MILAWTLIAVSLFISTFTLEVQSIRLDESQSVWIATKSIPAIFNLVAEDVHVPLYFLILHFWLQIFGTQIAAARALSLLFFILSLPILYKLISEVSDKTTAWITVGLFSLSPFIVWYSSETRMYTLFILVSSLQNLSFIRFLKSFGKSYKLMLGTTSLIGFFTHYFFTFQVITQFVYLMSKLWIRTSKTKPEEERIFPVVLRYIYTLGSTVIFFVPWIYLAVRSGVGSTTQPVIVHPTSFNLLQAFVNFFFGFQPQGIQSVLISLWPVSVLGVFLIFTQQLKSKPLFLEYFLLMAFFPIALAFAVSFIKPLFLSRYLIFVTPNLFFILAWVLISYTKRFFKVALGLTTAILLGLLIYQNTVAASPVKEDYQSVANYLNQEVTPKDIITLSAPFTIYPIEYYYRGYARIATIPEWDRYAQGAIPGFSQQGLESQINTYKSQYIRIFVVLSYDQGYESQIRNYFENNFQRIDFKQFSPGLELRVYRLRYDVDLPKHQ